MCLFLVKDITYEYIQLNDAQSKIPDIEELYEPNNKSFQTSFNGTKVLTEVVHILALRLHRLNEISNFYRIVSVVTLQFPR